MAVNFLELGLNWSSPPEVDAYTIPLLAS